MIIAALLTSLTIAREWENGTMEQLLSTPVRPRRDGARETARRYFLLGLTDMLICLVRGRGHLRRAAPGQPGAAAVRQLLPVSVRRAGWGLFISAMFTESAGWPIRWAR